jgi:hypothetical protein
VIGGPTVDPTAHAARAARATIVAPARAVTTTVEVLEAVTGGRLAATIVRRAPPIDARPGTVARALRVPASDGTPRTAIVGIRATATGRPRATAGPPRPGRRGVHAPKAIAAPARVAAPGHVSAAMVAPRGTAPTGRIAPTATRGAVARSVPTAHVVSGRLDPRETASRRAARTARRVTGGMLRDLPVPARIVGAPATVVGVSIVGPVPSARRVIARAEAGRPTARAPRVGPPGPTVRRRRIAEATPIARAGARRPDVEAIPSGEAARIGAVRPIGPRDRRRIAVDAPTAGPPIAAGAREVSRAMIASSGSSPKRSSCRGSCVRFDRGTTTRRSRTASSPGTSTRSRATS